MAVVQVNTSQGTFGSGSSTTVATPATSLTAGNRIVILIRWTTGVGAVSSIADTAGNTYTLAQLSVPGGSTTSLAMYYVADCLGDASNVVTVTFTAGVSNRSVSAVQYSGSIDYELSMVFWQFLGSGGTIEAMAKARTSDGLLVVGTQVDAGGSTWTAGSGLTNAVEDDAAVAVISDAIITSPANLTPQMSSSDAAGKLMVGAIFVNTGSGGSPSPPEEGGGSSRSRVQRRM